MGGAVLGYVGGERAAEAVVEQGKDAIYQGVNGVRHAGGWVKGGWDSLWGW